MSVGDFQVIDAPSGGSSIIVQSDEDDGHNPYVLLRSPGTAQQALPAHTAAGSTSTGVQGQLRGSPRSLQDTSRQQGARQAALPACASSGSSDGGDDGDAQRADMILHGTYQQPSRSEGSPAEPPSARCDANPGQTSPHDSGHGMNSATSATDGRPLPAREPQQASPLHGNQNADTSDEDAPDGQDDDSEGEGGSLLGLLSGLDERTLAAIPPALLQRLQQLEEERDELAERLLESDAELCALRASYTQLSQSHASSQTWLNQVLEQQMELHERRQRRKRHGPGSSSAAASGAAAGAAPGPAARSRLGRLLAEPGHDGALSADVTGELDFVDDGETETDRESAAFARVSVTALSRLAQPAAAPAEAPAAAEGAQTEAFAQPGPTGAVAAAAAVQVQQLPTGGAGDRDVGDRTAPLEGREAGPGGAALPSGPCSGAAQQAPSCVGTAAAAAAEAAAAAAVVSEEGRKPASTAELRGAGVPPHASGVGAGTQECCTPEPSPSRSAGVAAAEAASALAVGSDGPIGSSGAAAPQPHNRNASSPRRSAAAAASTPTGAAATAAAAPESSRHKRSGAGAGAEGKAGDGATAHNPKPSHAMRPAVPPVFVTGAAALLLLVLVIGAGLLLIRPAGRSATQGPAGSALAQTQTQTEPQGPRLTHGANDSAGRGPVDPGVEVSSSVAAAGGAHQPAAGAHTPSGLAVALPQADSAVEDSAASASRDRTEAHADSSGLLVSGPQIAPSHHSDCAPLHHLALALSCAEAAGGQRAQDTRRGRPGSGVRRGLGGGDSSINVGCAEAAAVAGPPETLLPRAVAVRGAMAELEARWRRLTHALRRLASASSSGGGGEGREEVVSQVVAAWAVRHWLPGLQRLVLSVADDDELPEAMLTAHRAAVLASRLCSGAGDNPIELGAPLLERLEASLAAMTAVASVHVDATKGGGAAAVELQLRDAARCLDWQSSRVEAAAAVAECQQRCRPRSRLAAALRSLGVPQHLVEKALSLGLSLGQAPRSHQHDQGTTDPDAAGFDAGAWLSGTAHLRGWLEDALLAEGRARRAWRPLLRAAGGAAAAAAAAAGRAARAATAAAEVAVGAAEAAAATAVEAGAAAVKVAADAVVGGDWRRVCEELTSEFQRLSGHVRQQWRQAASGARQRAAPGMPALLEEAVQGLLAAARRAYREQYEALRCDCGSAAAAGGGGAAERRHVNGTVGLACAGTLEALVLESQRELAASTAMAAADPAAAARRDGGCRGVLGVSGELSGALLRLRADVQVLSGAVGRVCALCQVAVEGAEAYRESQAGAAEGPAA